MTILKRNKRNCFNLLKIKEKLEKGHVQSGQFSLNEFRFFGKGGRMNIHEMVREHLEKNGYEGLVDHNGFCGCGLDDFMPCDEAHTGCEAGYKVPCNPETCENDGDCGFHITAEKPTKE